MMKKMSVPCIWGSDMARLPSFQYTSHETFDPYKTTGVDLSPSPRHQFPSAALSLACSQGNVEVVSALLKKSYLTNVPDEHGRPPLLYAAEGFHQSHLDCLQVMLDLGCDVNKKDSHGDPAIMVASRAGRKKSVHVLLRTGLCNVNEVNIRGQTPLHMAITNGHGHICELLLDAGADPNVQDKFGGITPLILAVTRRDVGLGRRLLEKGADVNLAGENGRTALHYACMGGSEQLVQLLADSGANVDVPDSCCLLPIHHVASDENLVRFLIDKGADVNGQNLIWPSWSPLHFACIRGNTHCEIDECYVRFLLNAGADCNKRINDQRPIDLAVEANKVGVVFELLYWICSVGRERLGERPLILQAILNGNMPMVQLLHIAGANISRKRITLWLGQNKSGTKYIETLFNEPRTLQSISRLCIRKSFNGTIHRKVHELPIPFDLQKYILLEEVRSLIQKDEPV